MVRRFHRGGQFQENREVGKILNFGTGLAVRVVSKTTSGQYLKSEKPSMTNEQRELIHQSAHLLRNRLTFIMLCSDKLKIDLRDVSTREHEQVFQRMDRVLQETKTELNTLLRELGLEPRSLPTSNSDGSQINGGRIKPDNAA